MPERFLTLADGDPRLEGLLLGDSRDETTRPLLIQSSPEWTFEFVPLKDIVRPFWLVVWIRALRPDSLVLSVGPILGAFGWLLVFSRATQEPIQLSTAALTVVGILALHASVNLFNDYHDHMRGWDRVREHGGARVISRGWLRARDVHRAAWAAFGIAMFAGAPVVLANLSSGLLLALFALAAALEFAISRFGLKYRGFAEVTAWFMFGPLLTGGFAWAMTGKLIGKSLALGAVYGSLALLCLHLKNFERILVDGRAGLKTWPVRAGFDASKTFTYFCLALISASMALLVVLVDPNPIRLLPMIVLTLAIGPLASRVWNLKSPLASRMRGLHAAGLRMAWFNLFAFALADLARLLDFEFMR
jgi:1,4-dihydroxy-2-naphthoate polyprenyltransferase